MKSRKNGPQSPVIELANKVRQLLLLGCKPGVAILNVEGGCRLDWMQAGGSVECKDAFPISHCPSCRSVGKTSSGRLRTHAKAERLARQAGLMKSMNLGFGNTPIIVLPPTNQLRPDMP